MPAEWEPHERCLMAWPTRTALWGERLGEAEHDYATIARAIARFEPVLMVAAPEKLEHARALCGEPGRIELAGLALDDSWLRDTGPIFVRAPDGSLTGVDFEFNGWGEKYRPYDADAALAAGLLELLGVPRRAGGFVLEGGAIGVDGEGTLVTTESVLLNPNRNPQRSAAELECLLERHLGAERVIWLVGGLIEDRDTDGHVDNVCHFLAPGRVIVQTAPDPASPNHAVCAENVRRLRAARDARGRRLEVIEMPYLPYVPDCEAPVAAPYLNFYLADRAVIVPVTGARSDAAALALLAQELPGREVVAVPGATLARGGGGVHCITQQQPRGL